MENLPNESCGELLKKARLAQGRSLHDLERETKIPTRYLEAIEIQRWDNLPAYVYSSGFVRSYAIALKLEPDVLLELFKRDVPPEPEPYTSFKIEPKRSRLPLDENVLKMIIAAVATIFTIALTATVVMWILQEKTKDEDVSPPKKSQVAAEIQQKPTDSPRPTSTLVAALATIAKPAATTTPAPTTAVPLSSPSPEPTKRPTITATPTNEPSSKTIVNLTLRLVAKEKVWVLVETDQDEAFTGFLRKGDDLTWYAAKKIRIRAGKPTALKCWINDREQKMTGSDMSREWTAAQFK